MFLLLNICISLLFVQLQISRRLTESDSKVFFSIAASTAATVKARH
jgi:hypothetical protein